MAKKSTPSSLDDFETIGKVCLGAASIIVGAFLLEASYWGWDMVNDPFNHTAYETMGKGFSIIIGTGGLAMILQGCKMSAESLVKLADDYLPKDPVYSSF